MIETFRKHKTVSQDFAYRVLQITLKNIVTFFIFFITARSLSVEDFAFYNYITAFIIIFVMFSDFGISASASKFTTEYKEKNAQALSRFLFNMTALVSIFALPLIAVACSIAMFMFEGRQMAGLLIALPLVLFVPLSSVYDGIYRGLGKWKEMARILVWVFVVSIVVSYFAVKEFGLYGAIISNIFFYLVLVVSFVKGFDFEHEFKLDTELIKKVGHYGLWYGVAIFGNYLFIKFGTLIWGYYNHYAVLNTYEILMRILLIAVLPFTLLGQVIAPHYTRLSLSGENDEIIKGLNRLGVIFMIIGVAVTFVLYFIIPFIIKSFFPLYYNELFYRLLPYVLFIFCMNVFSATIDAGIVVPAGFAITMAKVYIVLGLLGLVCAMLFYMYFGFMGVVYSFTLFSVLMVVVLRLFVYSKIKSQR